MGIQGVPSRPGRPGGTACLWARASPPPPPPPSPEETGKPRSDVHQLRAGHWTISTSGDTGSALQAVKAVRQPAVQRGLLPGMPGGSRHPEACGPALPGPHEHPVQAAGMPLPEMEDVRSADVVAALGAAYRDFLSRTATP